MRCGVAGWLIRSTSTGPKVLFVKLPLTGSQRLTATVRRRRMRVRLGRKDPNIIDVRSRRRRASSSGAKDTTTGPAKGLFSIENAKSKRTKIASHKCPSATSTFLSQENPTMLANRTLQVLPTELQNTTTRKRSKTTPRNPKAVQKPPQKQQNQEIITERTCKYPLLEVLSLL